MTTYTIPDGHGGYHSYLYRFGHDDSPFCPSCKDSVESPEHVLFKCKRFEVERRQMYAVANTELNADNLIQEILKSSETWKELRRWEAIRNARMMEQ